MPQFAIGEEVRIRHGETPYAQSSVGRTGKVVSFNDEATSPYPYEVEFGVGRSLCFTERELERVEDMVDSPTHYTSHPSGVECIEITQHMNFPLGSVIKYVWRAGLKTKDPIQDLEKARQYLDIEITRLKEATNG